MASGKDGTDLGVIRRSLASRAKYRLDQGACPTLKRMPPPQVVPHPRNRGGDPVKSLRTLQLTGTIAKAGFDIVEASGAAVAVGGFSNKGMVLAVHIKAAHATTLQTFFEASVKADPDMATSIDGQCAVLASLFPLTLQLRVSEHVGG